MKVLLIAPYRDEKQYDREDFLPSSALLCLAASLREAGHTPILRDFGTRTVQAQKNPTQYCFDNVTAVLNAEKPELVGISFMFSGLFPMARKYAQLVRKVAPYAKIITGGIHCTTFPKEILTNCSEFDYIAIGEGEAPLVAITNRMAAGDLSNLTNIKGFAFRAQDGSVHVSTERDLLDYDKMPMQAWDMIDLKEYEMNLSNFHNPKQLEIKNVVPLVSERGCPYKCNFCDLYLIQGRKMRRRSADNVVNEIEYLVKERGMRYFSFQDDNLVRDNRHIMNICKEIKKRKLDIHFETASGLHVDSLTDEVIDHMVEAGLVSALLSIEHGSEYMRKNVIGKNLSSEKIYWAGRSLRRHNVLVGSNWIMGFPEDTNETLQETLDMINTLKPDRAAVGVLIPFPMTKVWDQCVRDNLFTEAVDVENLWNSTMRPHQDKCVIKPYNMSMEDLAKWRQIFIDVRYKYFGYYYPEFKLPKGFERVDGEVRRISDFPQTSIDKIGVRMAVI